MHRFAHTAVVLSTALALLTGSSCTPLRQQDPGPLAASDDVLSRGVRASLEQAIAAREYRASRSGGELQAPNRAQNLRTWFGRSGIRVHDRTAPGSPELVAMELRALSRGPSSERVGPGEVSSDGTRVEIARAGIVEWYQNGPDGLEQGFTLASHPLAHAVGELALELGVSGASASETAHGLVLATQAGRTLAYGKLEVRDASGRNLSARLEAPASDRIRLIVQDAGATYPVVIDPLLQSTADGALESNQLDARLGTSVASAGDVNGDGYADVIVGAPYYDSGQANEGAAFLALGSANGTGFANPSTAAAQFESNQADAWLGISVASAGDVNGDGYADVIVGAPNYSAGHGGEGAAFVFLGSASGISDGNPASAHAQLEADQDGAQLGHSVASAGDVNGDGYADVIVGSLYYSAGQDSEGAAFVFHGSAAGIADGNPATATTRLESDQEGAVMGNSVASAGDVNGDGYADVIVGAYFYSAGQNREGAAFVFLGSAAGIDDGNPETASAQLESDQASAEFGYSVASAGDVNGDGLTDVIVGSRLYNAGEFWEGAAFVFRSLGGIADGNPATAHARLEGNQAGAQMGYSVASAGDVNGDGYSDVVVGAQTYTSGQNTEGSAFVFLGSTTGIASGSPASARFALEPNQAVATLGISVASAGDVNGDGYSDVIAGAPLYDAGQAEEGAAFVYFGGGLGIADGNPASAGATLQSNQGNAQLGFSVASAGDVNGDRLADVIVGARLYDSGQNNEGAAFVFLGSSSGVSGTEPGSAHAQFESDQAGAEMGYSVASAGDVNGDGYADVIVGAPGYSAGQPAEGAAFVFLGSSSGMPDGTPSTAHAQLEADQASAFMGTSVASAGDVNGDGRADVIVGAYFYSAGQPQEGAAFVFAGSASGIADGNPGSAMARLESDQGSSWFGWSVASAGNVNGDRYADVVVGAPAYSAGESGEGAAFVFHGSATGIANANPVSAHTQLESDRPGAGLGWSVASAGDVDADGFGDLIIGSPSFPAGPGSDGAAFVFRGSVAGIADGDTTDAEAEILSDQSTSDLGASVASAGDVNGDGYADVIVGAPGYSAGQNREGVALVYLGSASGIPDGTPPSAHAQLESDQADAGLGRCVAAAGDLNQDGFADVIVGALDHDAGQTDEGAAFVFLGNGNRRGRPVGAAQGGAPRTSPWGISVRGPSRIELYMDISHPEGRGALSAEIEACPAGVPFGSAACRRATRSWVNLLTFGSGSVYAGMDISGLSAGTLYRWRARMLHAPVSVLRPGIALPPHPAHGPWRRLNAQAAEADIRTDGDTDLDGVGNRVDNCPFHASPITADTDGDGRGDPCECTDQDGDGRNTVSDLVAINMAIFNPGQITPLCDGNNDGKCNVNDIVAANVEIFSPTSTSTCARQPVAGP